MEPDKPVPTAKSLEWKWWRHKSIHCGQTKGFSTCSKIAMFDMDGTLIKVKSGKNNPVDAKDWLWFDPCVPLKIKEVHNNGYGIVLLTNQKGISLGLVRVEELEEKVMTFAQEIGVNLTVFMATKDDEFRKPGTGVIKYFESLNGAFDKSASYYVGDSAGRPAGPGRGKDYSDCDRFFAINAGLPFYTPEEYFLNKEVTLPQLPKVEKGKLLPHKKTSLYEGIPYVPNTQGKDMVFMIGAVGSGKSTFCFEHLSEYFRIDHVRLF